MCPRDEQIHVKPKLIACFVLCVAGQVAPLSCVPPPPPRGTPRWQGEEKRGRINCTAAIRLGGVVTLGTMGGVKGTDRERTRAQGLFDLIGLGGDFDSLLIAFICAEVMSFADAL